MPGPFDPQATGDERGGTVLVVPLGDSVEVPDRYAAGAVLSGKYQLDSLLGEGGMGSVWRATNLLLELPVAIKLIRSDLDRGSFRARLQIEARSAAKLGHPAIVRVFDVGQSELGDPFIVMELLQGETLAHMLGHGRMSGVQAVQLLLPIIDALGMAHARGIVHRDLKPDNLMIALEDQHVQPKILDFGVAKLTDPRDSDHKLTEVGTVVGSPDYMSPEQARGREDVDSSTDIWSISIVLYEAVTGSSPFRAANYNALLRAIVEDEPQSIVEHAAGDEQLWQIIQQGLAKDRRNRYATMSELGQALAAWLVSHGVREDACGASLESKWLGHPSDRSGSASGSGSTRALSAEYRPQVTQGAGQQFGTGVGRGPFTAEVPARVASRRRRLGLALGVCTVGALLVLAALSFQRKQPAETALSSTPAAVPPRPGAAATDTQPDVRVEPASAPPPAAALVSSGTQADTLTPLPSANHSLLSNPTARAAKTPAALSASAPLASPAAERPSPPEPSAQPPKAADRPLDLLTPY